MINFKVNDKNLISPYTWPMRAKSILSLTLFILSMTSADPANGAGTAPKIKVNCGQISGQADQNGTYGLFKPDVTVSYYGSPLTVTSYFYRTSTTKKSDTGQYITTFTNKAPSTRYFVSKVDLQHKVLEFGQPQTGYFKFVIEAVDTLKRKSSFTCIYKDYRYSTAIAPKYESGGSSSGISSRGFNQTACTFDGKQLYGLVYFTKYSFDADFKVYVSDYSFDSDLKVYLTDYSFDANSCGKWYATDYSFDADFKVYLTNYSFESDFKIYETDYSFDAGS